MGNFLTNAVAYLSEIFSKIATRLIIAALILLVGLIIGKLVQKILQRVLGEIELNNLVKRTGFRINLEALLAYTASYMIYFLAFVISLNYIGLVTTITNIVAIGAIVVAVISFILTIKDAIPNISGGLYIHYKHAFSEGDQLKIGGTEGTVRRITLLETVIETKNKESIHIPNINFTKKEFKVKSQKI